MSGVRQQVVARDEDGMRLDRWFATHFPQVDLRPPAEAAPLRPGPRRQRPGQDQHAARRRGRWSASRRSSDAPERAAGQLDTQGRPVPARPDPLRGRRHLRLQQAARPRLAGRQRHQAAHGRAAEEPAQQAGRSRRASSTASTATPRAASSSPRPRRRPPISARCSRRARRARSTGPSSSAIRTRGRAASRASSPSRRRPTASRWWWSPNGTPGAQHSMSYYSTTDTAGRRFAWVTLKPVTGRTHQLRVHMAQLGNPIIGDPRYFNIENWEAPEELSDGPPPPRPPHRPAAARRQPARRLGAAAAAHGADLRRAWLRRRALRRPGQRSRRGLITTAASAGMIRAVVRSRVRSNSGTEGGHCHESTARRRVRRGSLSCRRSGRRRAGRGQHDLLHHQRRQRRRRQSRRPRRRRRHLHEARRSRRRRRQDLARLSQRRGRQRQGPHRRRPVAELQGRRDRHRRRQPPQRRQQHHQGDRRSPRPARWSTAVATSRTSTTS